MGTFKLSFEANEIDEKLKVIEDGGAGYTEENGTIHPIDPKFLPSVEINLDGYGFSIGYMVMDAYGGNGVHQNIEDVGTFWGDIQSKKPIPVCVTEIPDFGTYKATPLVMTDGLVSFLMDVIYGTLRLSVTTIIQKNGDNGADVYVSAESFALPT